MSRNPFSLYDFLGYVFPGAFALLIIFCEFQTELVASLSRIPSDLSVMMGVNWIGLMSILLIFSYIIGHLFSFLSSAIIERFFIWLYGHPSSFLLNGVVPFKYWHLKPSTSSWEKVLAYFWRIVFLLVLFPLSICSLILGRFLNVRCIVIKELDKPIKEAVESKVHILLKKLQIENVSNQPIELDDIDFHKIVYHYEFEHHEAHAKKIDNYLALCGFLRTLTLIINTYLVYLLVSGDPLSYTLVLFLCLLDYVLFLGFMKFYARTALESFMCLITDKSLLE